MQWMRAAEDFGLGVELDVDFQSDYGFPSHKVFLSKKKVNRLNE